MKLAKGWTIIETMIVISIIGIILAIIIPYITGNKPLNQEEYNEPEIIGYEETFDRSIG